MALLLYPELLETRTYPFQRLRYMHEHMGLQEGVYAANDGKVVQRAAGANMSVDVGAGSAWVRGETGTRQGFYHVVNDATVNLTVTAAHATLPRIDQVILRVFDSTVSGGSDVPTLSVLAGTATSGATLDNRTGAAALPNDAIRLADILVAAADTAISDSEIRDRRLWAQGAYHRIERTSGSIAITNSATTLLDATNLRPRIECTGSPLRVRLLGNASYSAADINNPTVGLDVDGTNSNVRLFHVSTASGQVLLGLEWVLSLAAGSHLIGPTCSAATGTTTFIATATQPLIFEIEEIIRQNAKNG